MESTTGDKRKGPPLPPIKGDGSLDYDGESLLWFCYYPLYYPLVLHFSINFLEQNFSETIIIFIEKIYRKRYQYLEKLSMLQI
jgi:hypothetical protein